MDDPRRTPPLDAALRLIQGPGVLAAFEDPEFFAAARRLYDACPWGTAAQRPDFLRVWLRHYGLASDPWLVIAERPGGELAGFLPLVRGADGFRHAGATDAEYGAWVAAPGTADAFIEAALGLLQGQAGAFRLEMPLLAPGIPLGWTCRTSALTARLERLEESRLVVPLHDPQAVAAWVKDRSRLRTGWNKLARTGKLSFRRVRDVEEIDRVLDLFVPMFDVRKAAAFGITPLRDDPGKRDFLLAQAREPDLLHVTVLERDGELLAAHVATVGTRELCIAGLTHSEFESRHSPGLLLLLELIPLAAREGFQIVDFTPGDDPYKERFAKQRQLVPGFVLHPTVRRAAWRRLRGEARRGMARLESRASVRPAGMAALALRTIRRARGRVTAPGGQGAETRLPAPAAVVRFPEMPGEAVPAPAWSRNQLRDVALCSGTREEYVAFLRRMVAALRAGGEVHTRVVSGVLEAACHLVPGPAITGIEVPEGSWILYVDPVTRAGQDPGERAGWLAELARSLDMEKYPGLRAAISSPALVGAMEALARSGPGAAVASEAR